MKKSAPGTLRLVTDSDPEAEPASAITTESLTTARLAALFAESGLTQKGIEARCIALHEHDERIEVLTQGEISRLKRGGLQASTMRVVRSIAAAYDVTIDVLDRYLGGTLTLSELLAARSERIAERTPHATYRKHPRWVELVGAARGLRPYLRPATFERLADTPYTWGPLEQLTAPMLADVADVAQRWSDEHENQ